MIISVGTKNGKKVEAVREVVMRYDFLREANVISRKVSSGVLAQPYSLPQIIAGAVNRSRNTLEKKFKTYVVRGRRDDRK